ncbi:cupin domain-containing protein [Roseovarius pacificus]|uniref:cupin domain-containing protein n=1 Tax=Roseovarius pacificus TaxID=337701 RepID=UPI0040397089
MSERAVIVSKDTAEHYGWGARCDGWILASGQDLLIIQERMPAGTAEVRHYHRRAKQFFIVLSGRLTMEADGDVFEIDAQQGIEIRKDVPHQARNDSDQEVVFLVVSAPTSRGDRVEAPGP